MKKVLVFFYVILVTFAIIGGAQSKTVDSTAIDSSSSLPGVRAPD